MLKILELILYNLPLPSLVLLSHVSWRILWSVRGHISRRARFFLGTLPTPQVTLSLNNPYLMQTETCGLILTSDIKQPIQQTTTATGGSVYSKGVYSHFQTKPGWKVPLNGTQIAHSTTIHIDSFDELYQLRFRLRLVRLDRFTQGDTQESAGSLRLWRGWLEEKARHPDIDLTTKNGVIDIPDVIWTNHRHDVGFAFSVRQRDEYTKLDPPCQDACLQYILTLKGILISNFHLLVLMKTYTQR